MYVYGLCKLEFRELRSQCIAVSALCLATTEIYAVCCSTWLGNHNVDQIVQRLVRRVRLRGGVCLLHVSWK